MTFASIIGHEQQKDILRRALERQRIAHAWLFEGADGIGKQLTALAFVRALLCENGQGCGDCSACRKVDHNNHPDIHLLASQEQSIKIDQVRELQQQLARHPLEGRWKICLIDGAERMTVAAANALLKTLEEPRPGTVLILLTDQPQSLLETIRSRCQRLPFARLGRAQLSGIIADKLELDDKAANVLAALSEGSLKKAFGQNPELYREKRQPLLQRLSALSAGSIIPTFALADELETEKEQLPEILDIFEAWCHDLLLVKQCRPETELVNLDLLELLYKQSKRTTTKALLGQLDALKQARYHLQRNVNRRLTLELMLIRMTHA